MQLRLQWFESFGEKVEGLLFNNAPSPFPVYTSESETTLSYVAGPGEAAVLSSWSSSPSTIWLAASSLSVDCGWRTVLADREFSPNTSVCILHNHLHSKTLVFKIDPSSVFFRNLELKGGVYLSPSCLAIPVSAPSPSTAFASLWLLQSNLTKLVTNVISNQATKCWCYTHPQTF